MPSGFPALRRPVQAAAETSLLASLFSASLSPRSPRCVPIAFARAEPPGIACLQTPTNRPAWSRACHFCGRALVKDSYVKIRILLQPGTRTPGGTRAPQPGAHGIPAELLSLGSLLQRIAGTRKAERNYPLGFFFLNAALPH